MKAIERLFDAERPPLIEVSLRATLSEPVPIKLRLLDRFRRALGDRFTEMDEAAQYEQVPGLPQNPIIMEPGALFGATFPAANSSISVWLFTQMLVTRWSLRLDTKDTEYPGFEPLRAIHTHAIESLCNCLDAPVLVKVANISYLNFLSPDMVPLGIPGVFSPAAQLQIATGATAIHKHEAAWKTRLGVDLRFTIENKAIVLLGEITQGFTLQTVAGYALPEGVPEGAGLDLARTVLKEFFPQLISASLKSRWHIKGTT